MEFVPVVIIGSYWQKMLCSIAYSSRYYGSIPRRDWLGFEPLVGALNRR
jgi:hypothetical protein